MRLFDAIVNRLAGRCSCAHRTQLVCEGAEILQTHLREARGELASLELAYQRLQGEANDLARACETERRKVEYLTRWRRQSEEPCHLPDWARVLWRDCDDDVLGAVASDLVGFGRPEDTYWRPADLEHFEVTNG